MLDLDEYIVNLLAALVHLRIFEIDAEIPIKDICQFTMNVSDRVPHLEYFHISHSICYDKRVGGELVTCDGTEHPRFEL
jgi:hypothetical protein